MIFVTMDETDLVRRTDYTIQYPSDDGEDDDISDDDFEHGAFGSDDPLDLDCDPPEAPELDAENYSHEIRQRLGAIGRAGMGSADPATGSNTIPWGDFSDHFNSVQPPVELLEPDAVFGNRGRAAKFEIHFDPPM